MVLGHQHNIFRARRLRRAQPLLGIELRRIEYLRTRRAVPPLAIKIGVRAKVDEHTKFKILPFHLLGRGFDIAEILRAGKREAQHQPDNDSGNLPAPCTIDQNETLHD